MKKKKVRRLFLSAGELTAMGIPASFHHLKLKDYRGTENVRIQVRNYGRKLDKFFSKGVGLIFLGGSLSGKTMLACLIAMEAIAQSKTVHMASLPTMTAALFNRDEDYGAPAGNRMQLFTSPDLLVIDELRGIPTGAKEQYIVNDGMRTAFYTVLESRYQALKPTIITTSLPLDDDALSVKALFGKDALRMIRSRFGVINCPDVPSVIDANARAIQKELEET